MSAETMEWLNSNTLIGFTDKRGHAWHYRADEQGEETNHYAGAVPIEDVRRRLFHWEAVEGELIVRVMDENGVAEIKDEDRKAIVRPDTGLVMGVFKQGYAIHQFGDWLLDNISALLDDDLFIGSAGLLKGGATAWVSVEVPDTITTPEGVMFRPNLLAATSHDGSLATTYQRVVTNVVCDNTMSAALSEGKDQRIKVKHSRYSNLKLNDARDALAIVHSIADDFAAEVAELSSVRVTDAEWRKFLDALAPVEDKEGRSLTMAVNKRDDLNRLWNHDERVAPWRGTKFGVVQAMNTYTHHVGIVRGADRAERNMLRAVNGGVDKLDGDTLTLIDKVLA
jgi:phage/plasmid-like protein (TIGR03299 family)